MTSEEATGKRDPYQPEAARRSYWRRFLPIAGTGLIGIAAFFITILVSLRNLPANAQLPPLPTPVIALLVIIQPTVIMLITAAIGSALAHRLSLRSHITMAAGGSQPTPPPFVRELPIAITAGVVTSLVIIAIDRLFRPYVPPALPSLGQAGSYGPLSTVSAVLYGGLVEEIMLRWGVMTLLGWLFWLAVQRSGPPRAWIMVIAIVLSSVLFGLGHLPALAPLGPVGPALLARTLILNGGVGLVLGWLYWRQSLEAGMLAHGIFHITAMAVSVTGLIR